MMPKEAPAPRRAQNRSACCVAEVVAMVPVGENDLMGNNAIQGETPRTGVEAVASKRRVTANPYLNGEITRPVQDGVDLMAWKR